MHRSDNTEATEASQSAAGLGLTPNEVVAFRIVTPDLRNFSVNVIKRRGPASKTPGEEYATPISWHKNLENAASCIVDLCTKQLGDKYQREVEDREGSIASAKALSSAITDAKRHALLAVAELAKQINSIGVDRVRGHLKLQNAGAPVDIEVEPEGVEA